MPTPGCSGGTGVINSGVQSDLVYSAGAAGLIGLVPGLEWLQALAIGLGLLSFDLSTLCPAGPPAMSSFTPAEALALVTMTIGTADWNSAVAKIQAIFQNIIWRQFCHCDNAVIPPAPTYPSQPSITIAPSYSGLAYRVTTNGRNVKANPAATGTPWVPTYDDSTWNSVATLYGPAANAVEGWGFHGTTSDFSSLTVSLPADVAMSSDSTALFSGLSSNQFRWEFDLPFIPAGTPQYTIYLSSGVALSASIEYVNGFGGGSGTNAFGWMDSFTHLVVGRNVIYFAPTGTWSNTTRSFGMAIEWPGSGPTTVPADCCAETQQLLNQIVGQLTLLQRQLAPFATVDGATHTGLTGNGQIAVQGLLGAKINPTTIPGFYGSVSGDPDTLWLNSWINWGNPDGWLPREFLRASPHVSMPRYAGQFTLLGYSIAPGIEVSITEIKREP